MFDFWDRGRLNRLEIAQREMNRKLDAALRLLIEIRSFVRPRRAITVVFGQPALEPAPKPKE